MANELPLQPTAKAEALPPYPLVSSPKTTISNAGLAEASGDQEDIEIYLQPRAEDSTKKISRRTRWIVLRLEGGDWPHAHMLSRSHAFTLTRSMAPK